MSHVAEITCEVNDLQALGEAAKACGLELVMNQHTFKWYGTHVGDYPLPAGFSKSDMGKCEHALRIPGNNQAYEIGVAKRKDGKEGYALLWDFWAGGMGLVDKVGNNADKLVDNYGAQVAKKHLSAQGYQVMIQQGPQGQVTVTGF